MSNVVDIEEALWARRTAQAEREITDMQARVTDALPESGDRMFAVYALIAAALCVIPQGKTPQEWRRFVENTFRECCAILPVERVDE